MADALFFFYKLLKQNREEKKRRQRPFVLFVCLFIYVAYYMTFVVTLVSLVFESLLLLFASTLKLWGSENTVIFI